jgi:SNF family Na+-dependent transporter
MKKNLINVSKSVAFVLCICTIVSLPLLATENTELIETLKEIAKATIVAYPATLGVIALIKKFASSDFDDEKKKRNALEELAHSFDIVFANPAKKLFNKINFKHK